MTRSEQLDRFAVRFEALLNEFGAEYDLTAVEVVGVLQMTIVRLSVNTIVSPRLLPLPKPGNHHHPLDPGPK